MRASIVVWIGVVAGCSGVIEDPSGAGGAGPDGTRCRGAECVDAHRAPVVCEGDPEPGQRRLRRLTHDEYDRTVTDLLGIESDHGERFVADTVVHGYDNHADALRVPALLAEQLAQAAEDLAARAVADLGRLVPCTPVPGDERTCARQFVERFAERAFRAPPTPAQVERYVALWETGAADGGFAAGVELVVSTMLQSPYFLYRTELGAPAEDGGYRLTGWEVASELSYLLWGTMPDEALLEAARSGELDTPEGIERQARRMLESPRSRVAVRRFLGQWLELDRVKTEPKDEATYPGFDAAARAALRAQAEEWLEGTALSGDGTLTGLLAGAHGEGRVGLLTLPAVLAVHARPNGSSPVHRGRLVRERLLCQELPPPPPGVVADLPVVDPDASTRERYAVHSSNAECAGCHELMDPIGFAFEGYDGIGQPREMDGAHPVDTRGEIVRTDSTDGVFDGPEELASLLADSVEVQECFALQWARFAYGTSAEEEVPCVVRGVQERFLAGGGSIEELLIALVTSEHFVRRVP